MSSPLDLDQFLREVERRAFKRVVYWVRDEDAALDIVQDSMMRLAESYSDRGPAEWPMLFQRILRNASMDWFRRQKVRQNVFVHFSELESDDEESSSDWLERWVDLDQGTQESAQDSASRQQTLAAIEHAVAHLPTRQREAFLLRYMEEFDVAETAQVMGCSEGSVKTHCSRALAALSAALQAQGIRP